MTIHKTQAIPRPRIDGRKHHRVTVGWALASRPAVEPGGLFVSSADEGEARANR